MGHCVTHISFGVLTGLVELDFGSLPSWYSSRVVVGSRTGQVEVDLCIALVAIVVMGINS